MRPLFSQISSALQAVSARHTVSTAVVIAVYSLRSRLIHMWITNFDQIFAVGTGGRFIRGSVCTQIYTVFQKKVHPFAFRNN